MQLKWLIKIKRISSKEKLYFNYMSKKKVEPEPNPNKDSFSYTITAPSLSKPATGIFSGIKENIIIDINKYPNPPLDPITLNEIYASDIDNVTISNTYPINSEFTQIAISSIIDPTKRHLILILYDAANNILPNNSSSYPKVKKIEVHMNDWSPPKPPPSPPSNNKNVIIGVVIGGIVLGGIAYYMYNRKNNNSRSRFENVGE